MRKRTDLLVFVEDPGPANYVAPISKELVRHGIDHVFLATGLAEEFLSKRHVQTETVEEISVADDVFAKFEPRLILTGSSENPQTLGLSLIREARKRRITTIGLIEYGVHVEYRFRGTSGNPWAFAPDWLLVPDEQTKKDCVRTGFPIEQIVVCGNPHFDYVLEQGKSFAERGYGNLRQIVLPGLSEDREVIVFLSEGSAKVEPLTPRVPVSEYTMTGRGESFGRTEIAFEEMVLALGSISPKPYVILRPHPKDDPEDFAKYVGDFDAIDYQTPILELLTCADLVVGLTSMSILEAVLLGKRTLSILPREVEKEWLPNIRIGITPHVSTRKQLVEGLLYQLRGDTQPMTDEQSTAIAAYGSIGRTVNFVEQLLRSTVDTDLIRERESK